MGRDQQAGVGAGAAAAHREKVKLFMGVLALQFLLAGFHIVSRAALNMGISKLVFIVYRNVISLALLAPFAYFLEKYVAASILLLCFIFQQFQESFCQSLRKQWRCTVF